ncbi:acetate--CoA ligase family protein, partial [candidate division KSB1 bacterium]|nr:acetate--CoA ligase family protein [candidate division KSB1 bacterium]
TDAAIREGLKLAQFAPETTDTLKKSLPATANIKNPVDVIGDARADRYETAVTAVMNDRAVDGVFVILTPQSMTEIESIANQIVSIARAAEKPIYTSFMGEADVAAGIDILQRNKIPHYILPETMCNAFASAHYFAHHRHDKSRKPTVFTDVNPSAAQSILDEAIAQKRSYLPEFEAKKVLQAYKLPMLAYDLVEDEKQVAAVAERLGFPLVMKVVSDDIVHKFDVGGVLLNIESAADAVKAYQQIRSNIDKNQPKARIQGILISRMVPEGMEVILGIKRDPSFGSVVLFGMGGIFVEILKDISLRIAPVAKHSAEMMIRKTKAYPLLAGARGSTEFDIVAVEECIQRLAQLSLDCPQIASLDINPLIVLEKGKGAFVADARIML